jgi:hypothetical protein
MPYIWVALLAVVFASGYGLSSALSHAEIQHMSDGIATQNKEAELTLATLTQAADNARANALNANKQLEDANVSAINAINSQRDSFKSQRMYDTHREGNSCTTTAGANTTGTTNSTTQYAPELSTELTEFLKSESYRADQIAQYAIICQKFVVANNCGVSK